MEAGRSSRSTPSALRSMDGGSNNIELKHVHCGFAPQTTTRRLTLQNERHTRDILDNLAQIWALGGRSHLFDEALYRPGAGHAVFHQREEGVDREEGK